jgi:hypothetical protein
MATVGKDDSSPLVPHGAESDLLIFFASSRVCLDMMCLSFQPFLIQRDQQGT